MRHLEQGRCYCFCISIMLVGSGNVSIGVGMTCKEDEATELSSLIVSCERAEKAPP